MLIVVAGSQNLNHSPPWRDPCSRSTMQPGNKLSEPARRFGSEGRNAMQWRYREPRERLDHFVESEARGGRRGRCQTLLSHYQYPQQTGRLYRVSVLAGNGKRPLPLTPSSLPQSSPSIHHRGNYGSLDCDPLNCHDRVNACSRCFYVPCSTRSRFSKVLPLLTPVYRLQGSSIFPIPPLSTPSQTPCTRLPSLVARVGFEPAPENDKDPITQMMLFI